MDQFDVYTFDIPKVSDKGESIATQPAQTKQFQQLVDAQDHAARHTDRFDRVMVIHTANGNQRLVEKYIEGEHIVPNPGGESV